MDKAFVVDGYLVQGPLSISVSITCFLLAARGEFNLSLAFRSLLGACGVGICRRCHWLVAVNTHSSISCGR